MPGNSRNKRPRARQCLARGRFIYVCAHSAVCRLFLRGRGAFAPPAPCQCTGKARKAGRQKPCVQKRVGAVPCFYDATARRILPVCEQRRRRAEVRTRLKALETEIEELGAHIVELENEINDPEVLRDHLLLRDKCDELDDSRFHQQELYDEWEKLAEEQDRMDAESDS